MIVTPRKKFHSRKVRSRTRERRKRDSWSTPQSLAASDPSALQKTFSRENKSFKTSSGAFPANRRYRRSAPLGKAGKPGRAPSDGAGARFLASRVPAAAAKKYEGLLALNAHIHSQHNCLIVGPLSIAIPTKAAATTNREKNIH